MAKDFDSGNNHFVEDRLREAIGWLALLKKKALAEDFVWVSLQSSGRLPSLLQGGQVVMIMQVSQFLFLFEGQLRRPSEGCAAYNIFVFVESLYNRQTSAIFYTFYLLYYCLILPDAD